MNLLKHNYDEKRDFIRMQLDIPAKLIVDGTVAPITGRCIDLSGGGLLVEIDKVMPIGTKIEVTIQTSHGHNPMLCASTRVVRQLTSLKRQDQRYLIGLKIDELLN